MYAFVIYTMTCLTRMGEQAVVVICQYNLFVEFGGMIGVSFPMGGLAASSTPKYEAPSVSAHDTYQQHDSYQQQSFKPAPEPFAQQAFVTQPGGYQGISDVARQ